MNKFILLYFMSVSFFSFSQNLIKNGSFEILSSLVNQENEVQKAIGWSNMTDYDSQKAFGTPDLFNLKSPFSSPSQLGTHIISTPQNGNSWVGLLAGQSQIEYNYPCEYIQYKFDKPLLPNVKYKFSYHFTNGSFDTTFIRVATNGVTAYFTKNEFYHYDGSCLTLPETSYKQEEVLVSVDYWKKVEHEFVLKDTAYYMAFGNFNHRNGAIYDTISSKNVDFRFKNEKSYYFFDNFVLEKVRQPILGDTLYQVCKGNEVELKVSGDLNNKWYNSKKQLIAQNIESFVVHPDSSTFYTVIGTTDTLKIKVAVAPKPQLIYTNQTICFEENLLLLNKNLPFYDKLEVLPSIDNYIIKEGGTYFLEYKLSYCIEKDTIEIKKIDCEVLLKYPNVFTPNGDGKNEFFAPLDYKNIDYGMFKVYNRWGKEIYKTEELLKGWDGKGVSDGVYFYSCDFVDILGEESTVNGWVQLIK